MTALPDAALDTRSSTTPPSSPSATSSRSAGCRSTAASARRPTGRSTRPAGRWGTGCCATTPNGPRVATTSSTCRTGCTSSATTPVRVDGVFGPETEVGLRAFQRDYGLTSDGTCGPATLARAAPARPQGHRRPAPAAAAERLLRRERPAPDRPAHRRRPRSRRRGDRATPRARPPRPTSSSTSPPASRAGSPPPAPRSTSPAAGTRTPRSPSARPSPTTPAPTCSSPCTSTRTPPSTPAGSPATTTAPAPGSSSTVGEQFANLVRREVIARTGMLDLGSHPKTWDLLRMTRMPAVRLDCGYLSHPVDRLLLLDARVRSAIAHAVLAAVQRLFLPGGGRPAHRHLRAAGRCDMRSSGRTAVRAVPGCVEPLPAPVAEPPGPTPRARLAGRSPVSADYRVPTLVRVTSPSGPPAGPGQPGRT